MQDTYFENRKIKTIERTRQIINDLPVFAKEFFIGIQSRTAELTRLNYAYDLRIFFDFLSREKFKSLVSVCEITLKDLENLTAFDIELFIEYLSSYTFNGRTFKCSDSAKERKLCTLRSFFGYYYKKDKLPQNVTAKVDLPKKHEKSIVKLEADEVVKLLNLVDSDERNPNLTKKQNDFHFLTKKRDVAILTLFLGTGIRISECVGLNKSDLDFKTNGFVVTRKGGNRTLLYFSDEVKAALTDYLGWLNHQIEEKTPFAIKIKNHDALFLSIQGNRISVRAVELLVKKYAKIITPLKKITPHKLRSTYGTALYEETQDIYVVADVLGHKDINTTRKHYAAMSDTLRRKAAKAVKLRDDPILPPEDTNN